MRTHPKKGQAGWLMLPVPSSDRRNSLSSHLARRQGAFPLTIDAVDWADVSSCPYLPLCHAPATSGAGRRWWVKELDRKSVGKGKRVSVRVDLGVRRNLKKKTNKKT